MDKAKKLFEIFPPVSTEEWMEKITADLKGADFRKKLVWKTSEGIEVMPFYRAEDLKEDEFPFIKEKKKGNNTWKIRQDIEVNDYRAANSEALDILMKGIDSLGFVINDPDSITLQNFTDLLKGIDSRAIEINFFTNGKAIETVSLFRQVVSGSGADPSVVYGAVEADPLGRLLRNGTLCIPPEKGFDYLAELVKTALPLSYFRVIDLKASSLGNAGADLVQELSLAVSAGVEYLNQLTSRGISVEDAASKIRFTLGTGSLYFPEIAKLRAARLLWATVMNGYLPGSQNASRMEIHSITTRMNKTVFDPYVNMLRTQTEAMSAVIGGADSVTVEPFDAAFRNPDHFSKRIARNQQLILKEEAYFDRVADPSAGSYYIENLTQLMADKAWALFIEIEEKGGFLDALREGYIQKIIKASAENKKSDVSKRKMSLLGTNIYPDNTERLPEGSDISRVFQEQEHGTDLLVEPVHPFRAAEVFEKLRLKVTASPLTPSVFLLTIGDLVMSKARARFSADFFGCAGYRILSNPGFKTTAEGAKAALGLGANIVVICSSDDEYAAFAPEIYRQLKDKTIVVVAGNPACADQLRSEGIEHFISIRSDVGSTLGLFNKLTGIL